MRSVSSASRRYGDGMALSDVLYTAYERRLAKQLGPESVPRHVGVMLDGNRRWARARGAGTSEGHQAGADNIANLLGWCEEVGVEVVTLWLLSTDNLTRAESRAAAAARASSSGRSTRSPTPGGGGCTRWGRSTLLPDRDARAARGRGRAHRAASTGMLVNIAVGYGGRREIADAVRSLLLEHADRGTTIEELAELLDVEHIAEHLYTKGQPDPDLVIRTSGEQRLGGFLLWQSAHSEFYFCEAYWPDFRKVDFLRALRAYGERHRRFGS